MMEFIAALIFIAASYFEFGNSPMNSFVLLVIAALYLKGFLLKKDSYVLVGSLIALIFAVLSTLALLASYANSAILGEEFKLRFELGIIGYIGLAFLKGRRGYVQSKIV